MKCCWLLAFGLSAALISLAQKKLSPSDNLAVFIGTHKAYDPGFLESMDDGSEAKLVFYYEINQRHDSLLVIRDRASRKISSRDMLFETVSIAFRLCLQDISAWSRDSVNANAFYLTVFNNRSIRQQLLKPSVLPPQRCSEKRLLLMFKLSNEQCVEFEGFLHDLVVANLRARPSSKSLHLEGETAIK